MYSYTKYLLIAAGIAFTHALPLQDSTPSITSITHWGDGCPVTATDFCVKGDTNTIIASFGSLDVSIGSSASQSNETSFCEIGLQISVPAGTQFSAVGSSYLDDLNLGSGITGSHIMTYTFSGSDNVAETRRDFVGPLKGDFSNTDDVPESERVWSGCGSAYELLITNRGAVATGGDSGTGSGSFNVGDVETVLEWRNC